jgi:hypothetical protein
MNARGGTLIKTNIYDTRILCFQNIVCDRNYIFKTM